MAKNIHIPIISGQAGSTILPLFSQNGTVATTAQDEFPNLDKNVQDADGLCLTGCDLVLSPSPPERVRQNLLTMNAGTSKNIVEACAEFVVSWNRSLSKSHSSTRVAHENSPGLPESGDG